MPDTNGNRSFCLVATLSIIFLVFFGGLCIINPYMIIPWVVMSISLLLFNLCYFISSGIRDGEQSGRDNHHAAAPRQHPNATGLSQSAISALPAFVYEKSTETQCTVCLGAMKCGDTAKKLPTCGHEFHVECIDIWLGSHSTCPNCRSLVQTPEDARINGEISEPVRAVLPRLPSNAGGLTRSAIMAIPIFVYERRWAAQCDICLRPMKNGELVKKLPICGHEFHAKCIDMWLGSHSTFPNCRSIVQAPQDANIVVEISEQPMPLPRQPSNAGGLSKSAIDAIPTFVYGRSRAMQCVVCLGPMKYGDMVKKLSICEHEFHVECIDMWLVLHSRCPNCKCIVLASA